jgi:hypothetical protein
MSNFTTAQASHEHSLTILNLLYQYDSFMDGIKVVADMGCGQGLDINWWANVWTRDDPPEPRNYLCYAVDKNIKILDTLVAELPNVVPIEGDFTQRVVPRQVDLMWAHDSFQYSVAPLETLKVWNETMNINGMLVLCVPQHQSYEYNRLQTRSYNGVFYHYNVCNLMYMLAVSGFDCRDCYVWMDPNNKWMYFAVYKSMDALDPKKTSWFDLADLNLVNDSVKLSLNNFGYVRQEDLLFTWLDRDWRFARN